MWLVSSFVNQSAIVRSSVHDVTSLFLFYNIIQIQCCFVSGFNLFAGWMVGGFVVGSGLGIILDFG